MAEEKDQSANNDFPETSENAAFSTEKNALDSASEIVQTESGTNEQETKDTVPNPPPIIINIPKGDNSHAIKANIISIVGIIVNIALFLITLSALWLTRDSVNISKEALSDSRKKDSAAVIAQAKIDSLDSIVRERDYVRDSINIALAIKSSTIGENSLNETKKSYEFSRDAGVKELRAYVFNDKITTDFISGNVIKSAFSFINANKTPAYKIKIFCMEGVITKEFEKNMNHFISLLEKNIDTVSVSNLGGGQSTGMDVSTIATEAEIKLIQSGEHKLVVGANIIYYDIFGNKYFSHVLGIYNPTTTFIDMYKLYNDSN